MTCRSWLFGVIGVVCALAGNARADEAPAAQSPLDVALADEAAGRFQDACPAIKRIYREDPRPSTLFRIAECYDKWGRIATAAVHYDDYLAAFDRLTDTEQGTERAHEETASARREVLEKKIPRVVLKLPRESPDSTRVLRKPLEEGPPIQVAVGVPLLIDPGEHVLTTEVPGRVSVFTKFSVKEGENRIVEVLLPPQTGKIEPTAKVKPLQPVPSMMPTLDPGIPGRRIAAYTLGGVGALSLLGGVVTGVITWAQKGSIEKNCRGKICNVTGEGAKDTAATTGLISSVAFPIAAATLGAGAILYFTEPAPSKFGKAGPKVFVGAAVGAGALEVNVRW